MRLLPALFLSAIPLPTLAKVPQVVTDIPPVHSIAAAVMGDLGTPVLLLDRGASAHSFQLRPSQIAAIQQADMVVWVGPELTPWLDKALAGHTESSVSMELLGAPGSTTLPYPEADGHSHDDGHDHQGVDPHAWLDPQNGKVWAEMIAAELAHRDPENAMTYAANAAAAIAAISAAEEQAEARLTLVKDRPILTFHDAYGYFTGRFGLTVAGSVAAGDATPPGARHLTDLHDGLAADACLFPETGQEPAALTALAEATGAHIGGALDPEGAALEPGPGLYPALITGLADTIAACPR